MAIRLSDHFHYKKLLRFVLPSIAMMVFTSIYGVVDGFFVSNFVGDTPFTAINFIYPFIMILGSFGFMFGTGGSALISKTLGEGNHEKAKQLFSMLTIVSAAVGIAMGVLGVFVVEPLAGVLGAEGALQSDCGLYGRIILAALPAFMLQQQFQSLFVTAEKPKVGLVITIAAGITNMVLDAMFIIGFDLGLAGAALATAASQIVGGVLPIFYFLRKNNGSLLVLGKPKADIKSLLKVCANGSSELLSNVAMSLVGLLYNVQLMEYAGEDGVAAYGVMMYVAWIFNAVFIGYSVGTAPIVGYHYGAENKRELKSIYKKSLVLTAIFALAMFAICEVFAKPLAMIFVSKNEHILQMTVHGFRIFSFQFLFCGFSIFGSGFFTALNNGLVSAIISFLRTLLFQVGAVFLLPLIFDLDGVWASVIVAEFTAAVLSAAFLLANGKKYGYRGRSKKKGEDVISV